MSPQALGYGALISAAMWAVIFVAIWMIFHG